MGIVLLLAILSSTPAADAALPIDSVEIQLPAGSDASVLERAAEYVVVRSGQRLARPLLIRSIENLYASGHFTDIEVTSTPTPSGLKLLFLLTPTPKILEFSFEGNKAIDSIALAKQVKLTVGDGYWPERLLREAEALTTWYRRRGFREVAVRPKVTASEFGVSVRLEIDEGNPTLL